jgi:hypothetical protein
MQLILSHHDKFFKPLARGYKFSRFFTPRYKAERFCVEAAGEYLIWKIDYIR